MTTNNESQLPDFAATQCVERLRLIADETRLAVLQTLVQKPEHVNELAECLGVERSLLSHHLKILREAGLVEAIREGKSMRYQVVPGIIVSRPEPAINIGCCFVSFDAVSQT